VRASQKQVSTQVGSNVALRCDSASPVEWRRHQRPLSPMAYAQNNVLTLNNVQLEDAGRYICTTRSANGQQAQDHIDLSVVRKSSNAKTGHFGF